MGKYRVETEDGKAYEIETVDPETPHVPAAGANQTPLNMNTTQGRFHEDAWRAMNPGAALEFLKQATTQPLETLQGMGQAQGELLDKSIDSFKRGDYVKAVRQGINYMIPVFGPGFEAASEKADKGEYGDITGMALGAMGGGSPEIPVVPKIQNLNPVQAKAVDYAMSRGIPVNTGTATGNWFLKGLQKGMSYTPIGSVRGWFAGRATEKALQREAGVLAEQSLPGQPMTAEGAGTQVRNALTSKSGGFFSDAQKAYAPWRQAEADPSSMRPVQVGVDAQGNPIMDNIPMPVDVRPLKQKLLPLYEKLNRAWEPAKRYQSRGLNAMRSIIEGPDFVSSSDAELSLGGLKRLSREDPEAVASGDVARYIIPDLQRSVDSAVAAVDPSVVGGLRRGRVLTRRAHEVQDIADELLTGGKFEPVQAYGQMTWRQDTGIEKLRRIDKEVPGQLQAVGRAYLEGLIDEATKGGGFGKTQTILTKWQNLGNETKKLLFPNPVLRENINDFLNFAQLHAENPNPSGTTPTAIASGFGAKATMDPLNAIIATLGTGGIAAALYSPKTAKLLTQGLRIPALNTAGREAQAAFWLSQVLRQARNNQEDLDIEKNIQEFLDRKGKKMLPYEYPTPQQ